MVEVLVAVEAGLLLAGAGYLVIGVIFWPAQEPMAALVMAAIALGMVGFLAACVVAVHRGRGWVRGPLLVWQALQVTAVMPSAGSATWMVVAVVFGSIAVAAGLFVPGVTASRSGGVD
jgi:hypothetical protein